MKKIFVAVVVSLLFVAQTALAMTFQQPVKVGRVSIPIQRGGYGLVIEGATYNDGSYFRKYIKDSIGYDKGLAKFGDGDDALFFHYNYGATFENSKSNFVSKSHFKFGDKNVSNTIADIGVGSGGEILQIKTDEGITFYSIRFMYQTSDLTLIGRRKDGKWVKYIHSKDISKMYFGGKDGYREPNGVIYEQVTVQGDTLIMQYSRFETYRKFEGEFRFKWNEAAQWFGVEQIIY